MTNTSKPTIFFLCTSLNMGGTESFLKSLVFNLQGRYEFKIGCLKEVGVIGRELIDAGFEVKRYNFFSLIIYLKKLRPEILQTFLYRANVLGRICGKAAGVSKIISTQQSIDIWKNFILTFFDRLTANLADLIIANSDAAAKAFHKREKIALSKIKVIYNGIDSKKFTPTLSRQELRHSLKIPDDETAVLVLLRLHYDKGADLICDIALKTPDIHYLVAGGGPQRDLLSAEIKDKGLSERVFLLGWRNDTPNLLTAADILLLPSREESFPQVILEAFAMKVPVVASRVGGVEEILDNGKNGFSVESENIEGFATALSWLDKNRPKLYEMGRHGFEKCQNYSLDKMIAEIDNIYHSLMGVSHG